MENLEFESMLVLSTSHITHPDTALLDKIPKQLPPERLEIPFDIFVGETYFVINLYGWQGNDINDVYIFKQMALDYGLSLAFVNLCDFAISHKAKWLCLDADGHVVETLPTFEWE